MEHRVNHLNPTPMMMMPINLHPRPTRMWMKKKANHRKINAVVLKAVPSL
jgi:hypothetical protein